MVKVIIWDDKSHNLIFDKVEKIEAVERLLQRIREDITGIEQIWGMVDFVRICTEDKHYNIYFTDNQFRKYKSTLEKLNGGEIPKIYMR